MLVKSRNFCNNICLCFCLNPYGSYLICGLYLGCCTNWQPLLEWIRWPADVLSKAIFNCCELLVTRPETCPLVTTILVKNLETLVWFLPPQCWFGFAVISVLQKYARLNIGEGEWHIWVRTKVWRVNVKNLENIQGKWLLFQRFVASIVFASVGHARVTKRMKGNHSRLQC